MSFWVIWPLAKDASRERATDLFEMVTCILQKVGKVRHMQAPSARSCISPSPFATFSALASNRPQKSRPVFRKRLAHFKYRGCAPSACTTLDRGGTRCHLLQVSLKFVRFCVLCLPFPPFCPSAHTYAGCRVSFDAVRSSRVLIWTSPLVSLRGDVARRRSRCQKYVHRLFGTRFIVWSRWAPNIAGALQVACGNGQIVTIRAMSEFSPGDFATTSDLAWPDNVRLTLWR